MRAAGPDPTAAIESHSQAPDEKDGEDAFRPLQKTADGDREGQIHDRLADLCDAGSHSHAHPNR